jgi:hypothetical protein
VETPIWRFAHCFTLAMSREEAFRLFADPGETTAWLNPITETEGVDLETKVEGNPASTMTVDTFDPPSLLRTTMTGGVIPGAMEITVSCEEGDTGTRITITRAGFGTDAGEWEVFGQSNTLGWDEAITDLIAYVHTGVRAPRHAPDLRASIAAWPIRRDWGIELAEVKPGGFCDRAGLSAGDLLLKLDRAGIYQISDIWTFTRARSAGEDVEATYVHEQELRTGRARLSRFEDFGD